MITRAIFFFTMLACIARAEPVLSGGETIAFLGDSITAGGYDRPGGYVQLVIKGLAANGIEIRALPAGVSGNTSVDMLARLKQAVLDKSPDWMTLSCGVNDVNKGTVDLPAFKDNIRSIVDQALAQNIRVVIMTATMIQEDPDGEKNRQLAPYNDFLRALTAEKGLILADANAAMQEAVARARARDPRPVNKDRKYLTNDGIHMNIRGNAVMARSVLQSIGLDDEQLRKASDAWLDIPKTSEVGTKSSLTLRRLDQLDALAASNNQATEDFLTARFEEMLNALLSREQDK